MNLKLAHIALSVANLETSIPFYQDHLGFAVKDKFCDNSSGLTVALLYSDNLCLELFESKDVTPLPVYRRELTTDLRTIGVKHFALEVEDIQAIHDRLKAKGVFFATPLQSFFNGLRYFFIKDPDGILIELIEGGK